MHVTLVLLASMSVGLAGCNAVFGITEATFDPAIDEGAAGAPAGGGAAGGAAGAGGGAPIDPVCASYCAEVMAGCVEDQQQYPSVETCLAICARLDNGPSSDMTGNTVECRANHAKKAQIEPAMKAKWCNAAGPLGGKVCGDPCDAFCVLNLSLCAPPTLMVATYPEGSACSQACAKFPQVDSEKSDFVAGLEDNSLNCRSYHLIASFKNDTAARTHCAHTAVDSSTCN